MSEKKLVRKKIIEDLNKWDIIDASNSLLIEKGIKGFTMDLVAKKAGMAKGTVYAYFKNKNILLEQVYGEVFNSKRKEITDILESENPFINKLKMHAEFMLKLATDNKILLGELHKKGYHNINPFDKDKDNWYGFSKQIITETLNNEIKNRKLKIYNVDVLVSLYLGSLHSMVEQLISSKSSYSYSKNIEELIKLFEMRIK